MASVLILDAWMPKVAIRTVVAKKVCKKWWWDQGDVICCKLAITIINFYLLEKYFQFQAIHVFICLFLTKQNKDDKTFQSVVFEFL